MTTHRALVVEDEPVAAEANTAYLRRLDVEVVAVAASGQEALRYSTPRICRRA
jgi:CheY-like chemotaxis protein